MQSRKTSALEAGANAVVGLGVSFLLTRYGMAIFGFRPSGEVAASVVAMFTGASFLRSYLIRRLFCALPARRAAPHG